MPTLAEQQQSRWKELTGLLDRAEKHGLRDLDPDEVRTLCRLYRQVAIDLSRARTRGDDPQLIQYLNRLAIRAHGQVYVAQPVRVWSLVEFVWGGFPRLFRRHWKPILLSHAVFYLTALLSFLAVVRQPDLAYSLFDPDYVEFENVRLERQRTTEPGSEYKGNFTFGTEQSPIVAVQIIGNNILVCCRTFAFGALFCIPCLLLLLYNGLMLGTLTGLMWNHGYTTDFYSLILTHGVLELTAICIAGAAGLMLGWSMIAPGQMLRREAIKVAARDAFGLLAGSCLMLVAAGIIEAYVTPHYPQPVRWLVAGTSGVLMVLYFSLGGRAWRRRGATEGV